MDKIYIKGPDGRIVAAQASQFRVVDNRPVLIPGALKSGWAEASQSDIAAQAKRNSEIDKALEAPSVKSKKEG